jgi:hypothetical protein
LGEAVEGSADCVGDEGVGAGGEATAQFNWALHGALNGFLDEVGEAGGDVVKQPHGVADDVQAADDFVDLCEEVAAVVTIILLSRPCGV